MKLSNTASDYSEEEKAEIGEKIHTFFMICKTIEQLFQEEHLKPTPPESNIIHVDFELPREFLILSGTKMPLHELVEVYLEWADRCLDLTKKNKGRLHSNKSLFLHFSALLSILNTFSEQFPSKTPR